MPWIESHTVLIRHRKVREVALELQIRPVYLLGHLHALWHAALEQQEDGDLSKWSDEFIADQASYDGNAKAFVACLQKYKLLEGKMIHDWLDYAGKFLTTRYSTSNREKLVAIYKRHGRRYGVVAKARTKREESDQVSVAPTQPTQPTKPTLPNPPNQAKGNLGQGLKDFGLGRAGNGRAGDAIEQTAMLERQHILNEAGVSQEVSIHYIRRNDIDPKWLRGQLQDIQRSGSAVNVGGILVSRIKGKNGENSNST